MNDEEILKNNILIVKFIGCTLSKESTLNHVTKWSGDFEPLNGKLNFPYNLKFHSSWDWLMPVIQRIYNYHDEECILDEDDSFYAEIMYTIPNIKETYRNVVRFIEWYNENKKV